VSRFKKATRHQLRLRMALAGPSGSGKTFTGLRFAFALARLGKLRVAVIDTEREAASKYAGYTVDGVTWNFDTDNLTNYAPSEYTAAIKAAGREGYDVVFIDSLSHAWSGEGGALDLKDKQGGNSFTAWRNVTPMHNQMIDAILQSPCHVIATMRSKTEYILEPDERGKMVPRKVGLAPIQRAGMEYEFDLVGTMECDTHILRVDKSRCPAVADLVVAKPTAGFMEPVISWLREGEAAPTGQPAGQPAGGDQSATPGAAGRIIPNATERKNGAAAGEDMRGAEPTTDLRGAAPPATEETLKKIENMLNDLGITVQAAAGGLVKKYQVSSFQQLSEDQAREILVSLEKKKAAKQATHNGVPATAGSA
jgi:hypothetical protein